MSGTTDATFKDFDIKINENKKEGGIYFKKAGIGGHFENGTVTMAASGTNGGAIFSEGQATLDNISFTNVTLTTNGGDHFVDKDVNSSAAEIRNIFVNGSGNVEN